MIHSLVVGVIPERGICCRVNDDIDTPDQVMPPGIPNVTMNPTDAAIFWRRGTAYSASAEAEDEFNGRTFQQLAAPVSSTRIERPIDLCKVRGRRRLSTVGL
jgi:hypothetical protein